MQTKAESLKVTGKLDFPADHPMLEHFKFLKANTKVTPKMTIPSPSVMHFRGGRAAISKDVYPEMGAYFDDLGKLYGKAIKAFYDAGCRYLQLDDTVWAYLCSKEQMAQARQRGEDADKLAGIYAKVINTALQVQAGRHDHHHARVPRQLPLHLDLGGRLRAGRGAAARPASTTTATSWSTTPIAPAAWSRCASCRRARSAWWWASSPPRAATLEKKDDIKRRLDEAAKFAPLEQLCLSPQCGFASTEEGNILTEDQQWAKLKMIVDISSEVWKS